MQSICLLTSVELILIPNYSLFYLYCNDTRSLKRLLQKKMKSRGVVSIGYLKNSAIDYI